MRLTCFMLGLMKLECLFAYSYLWAWGFCSIQEYNVHLDKLFSETPDDEICLALEGCSNNYKETFAHLKRYFEYEVDSFDSYIFGHALFNGLEAAYKSSVYTITEFGYRCYQLWKLLPRFLSQEQPFWILSYADDPLSWGDEEQSKALYEKAFCFYKEK